MFFKWTGLDWTGLDWTGLDWFFLLISLGWGGGFVLFFLVYKKITFSTNRVYFFLWEGGGVGVGKGDSII